MSKSKSLDKVAGFLLTALKASGDKRLAPLCAEYLVAMKLLREGHDVEVLQKRRGPDLRLGDIGKSIEVKSGHADLQYWSCSASFGNGKSIKEKKFHFCVFVIFRELEPSEYLVFDVDELREVAEKPRPYPITAFPNNACALFRYGSLEEYEGSLRGHTLDIELELHRFPERFRDKWDKIK